MTSTSKRGRKSIPHRTSWGENIDGLYYSPTTKRWRIVATAQQFREPDERLAVARFRNWQASQRQAVVVAAAVEARSPVKAAMDWFVSELEAGGTANEYVIDSKEKTAVAQHAIDEDILWPWLRKVLLEDPAYIAERVAIPQLASLARFDLPRDSIKLEKLIKLYEANSGVKEITRRKSRTRWDELTEITGAKTLADLTTAKLIAYRDKLKERGYAPETVANYFTRIKTVIAYGYDEGLDNTEIKSALDRCRVLKAPKTTNTYKPTPMPPETFSSLLEAATALERAALLLSLNCCMYCSEVVDVDWSDLSLDAGTLVMERPKTNTLRVAVLWPRTIAALKAMKQKPGKVFKSSRGDGYHPNSFRKLFSKLRKRAKVAKTVEYNWIRDGSYTAACGNKEVTLQMAEIVASHRIAGQVDRYFARKPHAVKPATDAIEAHYFRRAKASRRKAAA